MTGYLIAALVLVALSLAGALAKYASSSREATVLRSENTRLWSLIQSMRAVTIEPQVVRQVAQKELVREGEAPRETRTNAPVTFARSTEREEILDEHGEAV